MQSPSSNTPGCLVYGLFVGAIIWVCGVLGLSAPTAWFIREVLVLSGLEWPWYTGPLIALVQALLIAIPLILLAVFTRVPGLRAAYLTWLLACVGLLCFAPARALPPSWLQPALLLQMAIALLLALALRLWARRRPSTAEPPLPFIAGLALALLLTVPWLIFGAFGSPVDTLLALLAGAALGVLGAVLIGWARAWAQPGAQPGAQHAAPLLDGLTLGTTLLILATGFGFGAGNLLLMAALPPLGFAGAALVRNGRLWSLAALVGGVAAAPLALFDPDEVTLILGAHEIPQQALAATTWALLLGLLVSAGLWAAQAARFDFAHRVPALTGLGLSVVVAGLCYALLGHPGFYGERLLVILRDQADLAGAPAIADREERLRFVYQTLTAHADTGQATIRADLDRFGVAYTPYYLVNALEVDGGPLVRLYLESRPEVDRILESPRLRPLPAPPPPEPGLEEAPIAPEWNISSIGADRVWEELGITGEGIVIGQSDSGVDGAHPALSEGYRGAGGEHDYNWLDPWFGAPAPRDYGQHGTHTLGSAAGRGGIGVAPGAGWFACSNLARNLGNPAYYLDCMQFMLAPYATGADPFTGGDPARAAHVLNNSWGCPPEEGCDAESLRAGVEALRAAGIFVVASAGNEGPGCSSLDNPIAIYDSVLTVGAVDVAGEIASFSSRGPVTADGSNRAKPDIVAPGADILSAVPGGGYAINSGTSMAGPHVAGVVALIWSANPALIGDIAQTERILLETARPYEGAIGPGCAGEPGANNVYGGGVVDAYAAVQAALALR